MVGVGVGTRIIPVDDTYRGEGKERGSEDPIVLAVALTAELLLRKAFSSIFEP